MHRQNSMKYPYRDHAWLAVDRRGFVAAFVTGGEGPIPLSAIWFSNERPSLGALPKRAEGKMLVACPAPDMYLAIAERGMFVYDWSDVHEVLARRRFAYELVSTPSVPLAAVELPDDIRSAVQGTMFTTLNFGEQPFLDVRKFVECVERPQ